MATIKAYLDADPRADAEALRNACEGWGTDEKGVIEVIAHRYSHQLKEIREAYTEMFSEDLIRRFEKELSGDLEKAVYRWMHIPYEREAILVNVALTKGRDYETVVELSCIPSSEELLGLRRAYLARYNRSLEEDVASHTSGDIRTLLVQLVSAYRYESDESDVELAKNEAKILHRAIKDREFNHPEVLRILGTRSKPQIITTLFHYRETYGDPIAAHLEGHNHNEEYVKLLKAAFECIRSPVEYLESVLRKATLAKTDKNAITRVIVTRAERDLARIKEAFFRHNCKPLEEAVANETHGQFKRFLLALLGADY